MRLPVKKNNTAPKQRKGKKIKKTQIARSDHRGIDFYYKRKNSFESGNIIIKKCSKIHTHTHTENEFKVELLRLTK